MRIVSSACFELLSLRGGANGIADEFGEPVEDGRLGGQDGLKVGGGRWWDGERGAGCCAVWLAGRPAARRLSDGRFCVTVGEVGGMKAR